MLFYSSFQFRELWFDQEDGGKEAEIWGYTKAHNVACGLPNYLGIQGAMGEELNQLFLRELQKNELSISSFLRLVTKEVGLTYQICTDSIGRLQGNFLRMERGNFLHTKFRSDKFVDLM